MSALNRHMQRYPNARKTTLRQKAKQDETNEALEAYVRMKARQERFDRLKRVLMPWRQ